VNVDGAIAAVTADLGFAYDLGNAVFLISRLPGLIAHAHEERIRQKPMRQIDPKDHSYDGARERRLPERRK
jgi:citrate synthase